MILIKFCSLRRFDYFFFFQNTNKTNFYMHWAKVNFWGFLKITEKIIFVRNSSETAIFKWYFENLKTMQAISYFNDFVCLPHWNYRKYRKLLLDYQWTGWPDFWRVDVIRSVWGFCESVLKIITFSRVLKKIWKKKLF